jgi:hypothetical protein
MLLYVGYAAYSISEIVRAIETGNGELLADHVDFPAVRESLKKQVRAALAAPAAAESERGDGPLPESGFVSALRSGMAGRMVDGLVTPEGIAALMAKRRAERPLQNSSFSFSTLLDHLSIAGPARLRLGEGGEEELTLALRGGRWKIVDVRASPEKLRRARVLNRD